MRLITLIQEGIVRSWWVWLFGLICLASYEVAHERGRQELERLYSDIQQEKLLLAHTKAEYHNLERQLDSRSDRAWVELRLMQSLGVVREGEKKVFFEQGRSD